MFGSLKKKLKEAIGRAKNKVSSDREKEPVLQEEQIKIVEEPLKEGLDPVIVEGEDIGETLSEEREEEKFVETIEKKRIPKIIEETHLEVEEAKEERRGLGRILTKAVEKELNEREIDTILSELKKALLSNDVSFEVAERISEDVKNSLIGKRVRRTGVEKTISEALRDSIRKALDQEKIDLDLLIAGRETFTIIFLGFNGVGKTTTLAKLAHKFKKYNPVIAAGDTFRAASIEQLEIHSERLGAKLIKHKYGSDSAAVVFDARMHAKATGSKLVLADTAGRSHSNVNLMDELKKVVRVNKPDMKLLVLDTLAGNDIYEQARQFDEAVGVDAIILTKADVYEKGGAALSAAYTIKKPILFLGTGQEYDDLMEFDAGKIANSLLD